MTKQNLLKNIFLILFGAALAVIVFYPHDDKPPVKDPTIQTEVSGHLHGSTDLPPTGHTTTNLGQNSTGEGNSPGGGSSGQNSGDYVPFSADIPVTGIITIQVAGFPPVDYPLPSGNTHIDLSAGGHLDTTTTFSTNLKIPDPTPLYDNHLSIGISTAGQSLEYQHDFHLGDNGQTSLLVGGELDHGWDGKWGVEFGAKLQVNF